MATKIDFGANGCIFEWKIKNISHSWLKMGETIDSPKFVVDALEDTKWYLWLFPSGFTNEKYMSFYLRRDKNCNQPPAIKVNFQIAILAKDGSVLKERTQMKQNFHPDDGCGFFYYEKLEKVFVTQKEAFLPQDTLTVQCMLWYGVKKPVNPTYLRSRTTFKVNQISFVWRIDRFSALKTDQTYKFKTSSIDFQLVLNRLKFEEKLILNIDSFQKSIKYFSFKVSVVDIEDRKEICGAHEYFSGDLKEGVLSTLLLSRKLMENKSRYLPNDILSLYCEYVYSEGVILYEHCNSGVIYSNEIQKVFENRNTQISEGKENPPALGTDLQLMYSNAIFSDTEIRTLKQIFPAHKAILSARSPVFRSIFSSDVKVILRGYVEITDLDDDIIHRMLLYLYTDFLEDLEFESAYKLYVAADKYQIPSLKSRCCYFMKDDLSPTTACEVLILAVQHEDIDLKCFVQNYMIENHKEVFGSEKWKAFMDTNIKLAADVMHKFARSKIFDQ